MVKWKKHWCSVRRITGKRPVRYFLWKSMVKKSIIHGKKSKKDWSRENLRSDTDQPMIRMKMIRILQWSQTHMTVQGRKEALRSQKHWTQVIWIWMLGIRLLYLHWLEPMSMERNTVMRRKSNSQRQRLKNRWKIIREIWSNCLWRLMIWNMALIRVMKEVWSSISNYSILRATVAMQRSTRRKKLWRSILDQLERQLKHNWQVERSLWIRWSKDL